MCLFQAKLSRRKFLSVAGVAVVAGTALTAVGSFNAVASSESQPKNTSREFVFSSCGICVNKCGLMAEVNNGVIRKLNPNHKFFKSRAMLCGRGNAGAKVPYDPDRLKKPLIRVGERGEGKFKEVSWEEAYDYIASQVMGLIKKYENRSSIAFASTEGFQEEFFMHLSKIVGSTNTVRHPTLCLASNIQGYSSVFGTFPDADIENADFVVMAGSNRAEAIITPDTIDMAKNRKKQTLVCIDPRATKTSAIADKWYPIKPGTDLGLVLAMINIIISEDLYDKDFVEKYTHGFAELKEHVKQYPVEWAERECEISADEILWLARSFAKNAPQSVWYPGRRSSFYANDVYYRRACAILNAIVGAYDRKGGLVPKSGIKLKKHDFEFPLFDFTKDRIDTGAFPFIEEKIPDNYKEFLPKDSCAYLSEKDGSWIVFRDAIISSNPYPVKGMFVYKQNPVESVPNRKKTLQMLKQMDFICTIDVAMSDTAWYSDLVLPESTYLERWDPAENLSGIVPIVVSRRPVIKPLFDTKSMHDVTVDLAKKFYNMPEFWEDSTEDDRKYLSEYIKAMDVPMEHLIKEALSEYPGAFEMLEKDGVFYKTDKGKYGNTLKEGARFKTRTGKIELYNVKYAEKGLAPLPVYQRPTQGKPGQFRFVVGRHGQFTHASTQNNIYLLEAYGDYENSIWINSKIALEKGLKAGDRVKVISKVGEQTVKVMPTEFIRPDVVYYVHGFGRLSKGLSLVYQKGASDAEILVDYADTISGNAAMHETFVEIQKA